MTCRRKQKAVAQWEAELLLRAKRSFKGHTAITVQGFRHVVQLFTLQIEELNAHSKQLLKVHFPGDLSRAMASPLLASVTAHAAMVPVESVKPVSLTCA